MPPPCTEHSHRVKDGRKAKGKRYPLALLFTLILLGKLAGETKLEGIIDWINERQQELKKLLNWPKRCPVHKTYTDALARVGSSGGGPGDRSGAGEGQSTGALCS
jgi:hypothetical protein